MRREEGSAPPPLEAPRQRRRLPSPGALQQLHEPCYYSAVGLYSAAGGGSFRLTRF